MKNLIFKFTDKRTNVVDYECERIKINSKIYYYSTDIKKAKLHSKTEADIFLFSFGLDVDSLWKKEVIKKQGE